MPYTNAATKALEKSLQEAQALTASSIGTEHILLGLLADEQDPAPRTLRQLGADPTPSGNPFSERLIVPIK
jgi:ATP-dependent Clp protease ATP-binding subunit ClpC